MVRCWLSFVRACGFLSLRSCLRSASVAASHIRRDTDMVAATMPHRSTAVEWLPMAGVEMAAIARIITDIIITDIIDGGRLKAGLLLPSQNLR